MKQYLLKYQIKEHFKENLTRYIIIIFSSLIAIVCGIYFAISGFSYSSLLTSSDKNIFAYISGTAEYSSIFMTRFWSLFLCIILIFCFNLVRETAFLNYVYLGYQMCLIVLSSSAIISLYGFTGIVNVVCFVVPINLVNFGILAYMSVISMARASDAKSFKLGFFSSFKERYYLRKFFVSVLILFVFCAVYSFVLPLVLKSFVVINY